MKGNKKEEFLRHTCPGRNGRRLLQDLCYGLEGTKRPEYCAEHAKDGMINVLSRRCTNPSCNTIASFGVNDDRRIPEFCAKHAKAGMVVIKGNKVWPPALQ